MSPALLNGPCRHFANEAIRFKQPLKIRLKDAQRISQTPSEEEASSKAFWFYQLDLPNKIYSLWDSQPMRQRFYLQTMWINLLDNCALNFLLQFVIYKTKFELRCSCSRSRWPKFAAACWQYHTSFIAEGQRSTSQKRFQCEQQPLTSKLFAKAFYSKSF